MKTNIFAVFGLMLAAAVSVKAAPAGLQEAKAELAIRTGLAAAQLEAAAGLPADRAGDAIDGKLSSGAQAPEARGAEPAPAAGVGAMQAEAGRSSQALPKPARVGDLKKTADVPKPHWYDTKAGGRAALAVLVAGAIAGGILLGGPMVYGIIGVALGLAFGGLLVGSMLLKWEIAYDSASGGIPHP